MPIRLVALLCAFLPTLLFAAGPPMDIFLTAAQRARLAEQRTLLAAALRDTRYLLHVAADYRLWARDPGEIIRNNRDGTRLVMEAADDLGIAPARPHRFEFRDSVPEERARYPGSVSS